MRIREGDPLEIFVDREGEVIFKKYSPIGELNEFATQYCDVLYRTSGYPVAICDRDHVIAVSGLPKRDMMDQHLSAEIDALLEKRQTYQRKRGDSLELRLCAGSDRRVDLLVPILSAGDITGGVALFGDVDGNSVKVGESELKLMQAAAQFLAKQTEE